MMLAFMNGVQAIYQYKSLGRAIDFTIGKLNYKVQLFWEGHKNLRHPPYGFDIYLVNVKTIKRMAQILVAF